MIDPVGMLPAALVIYACAAFGLAVILGHSKITEWPRGKCYGCGRGLSRRARRLIDQGQPLRGALVACPAIAIGWVLKLIECPMCMGFWEGLITVRFIFHHDWPTALLFALATCGTNLFLSLVSGLVAPPGEN